MLSVVIIMRLDFTKATTSLGGGTIILAQKNPSTVINFSLLASIILAVALAVRAPPASTLRPVKLGVLSFPHCEHEIGWSHRNC